MPNIYTYIYRHRIGNCNLSTGNNVNQKNSKLKYAYAYICIKIYMCSWFLKCSDSRKEIKVTLRNYLKIILFIYINHPPICFNYEIHVTCSSAAWIILSYIPTVYIWLMHMVEDDKRRITMIYFAYALKLLLYSLSLFLYLMPLYNDRKLRIHIYMQICML